MMPIDRTGKSKKCVCYFYLILDSKPLTKVFKHTVYDQEAKELLGKAKEHLSKVSPPSPQGYTLNLVPNGPIHVPKFIHLYVNINEFIVIKVILPHL